MRAPFREFMTKELGPSTVLIACGLPASYKTETTEVIARLKGYIMLRTDMIRLEVLRGEDIFDEKVAPNMDKRKMVYEEMFRLAHELATKGESLILDATFIAQSLRRRAAEVAELIKQTVAKGESDLELDLFLHACKRTGLDPLMKQIYAIKRWNSQEKKETMAIQTGIDGYRFIADRTGRYAGSYEPVYEVGPDGFPSIASVTIYNMIEGQRCAFGSSARWTEYVQTTREGQPTAMWKEDAVPHVGEMRRSVSLEKSLSSGTVGRVYP